MYIFTGSHITKVQEVSNDDNMPSFRSIVTVVLFAGSTMTTINDSELKSTVGSLSMKR